MWGAELVLFFCYVDFAYKLVLKLTGYPITIDSHSKTSVGLVGPLFFVSFQEQLVIVCLFR